MAFSATRMLMAAAGNSVTPPPSFNATLFTASATTNVLQTSNAYSGGASVTGIISFWIRPNSVSGIHYILGQVNINHILLFIQSTGSLGLQLIDASGSNIYEFDTSNSVIAANTWQNILISWNTTGSAGSRTMNLYVNNTLVSVTDTGTGSTINVDYNDNYYIAGNPNNNANLGGCLSEFYFAPGQFLDFTVSGNRAKFISGGMPVNLGSSGQIPTGTSPAFYWPGLFTNLTNPGTVGGTYTQDGSISACATAP